ncbi:formimidoylglutamase [Sphingobacterium endophyticum]|uniref:formimidoylglutamase n=1 Tax=Sphingobacterium endophyticum TaxID=2546448 RepID=UPI0012E209BF|nr:formimidoylglutamase [Sphingobacterium endophyticum]
MEALGNVFYKAGEPQQWSGRMDGDSLDLQRWHQVMGLIDLDDHVQDLSSTFVLLGFCCDEGVKRNQGRIGAKDAPASLRKVLANLPNHLPISKKIVDAGDVICVSDDLESAQNELSKRVAQILEYGGKPIVLGGGHEVTYAHFNGLKRFSMSKKIGIINFDAHLDCRNPIDGQGNSGTGFFQIMEEGIKDGNTVKYLAIGIQEISNTKALFNYANERGIEIIKSENVNSNNLESIKNQMMEFAKKVDHIYVTVDMDVFASAFAPGVSAPAFNGIIPDTTFQSIYQTILDLPNFECIDIAEINPLYDIDNRTTKLASDLIFKLVNNS